VAHQRICLICSFLVDQEVAEINVFGPSVMSRLNIVYVCVCVCVCEFQCQ